MREEWTGKCESSTDEAFDDKSKSCSRIEQSVLLRCLVNIWRYYVYVYFIIQGTGIST